MRNFAACLTGGYNPEKAISGLSGGGHLFNEFPPNSADYLTGVYYIAKKIYGRLTGAWVNFHDFFVNFVEIRDVTYGGNNVKTSISDRSSVRTLFLWVF